MTYTSVNTRNHPINGKCKLSSLDPPYLYNQKRKSFTYDLNAGWTGVASDLDLNAFQHMQLQALNGSNDNGTWIIQHPRL